MEGRQDYSSEFREEAEKWVAEQGLPQGEAAPGDRRSRKARLPIGWLQSGTKTAGMTAGCGTLSDLEQ